MENSRSLSADAAYPDFVAFEAGVRARLAQHRALPPDAVQGVERLGRLVHILRAKQHWSLEALATRTGLPWFWLALLEQGMLLPAELTTETLHQLGRAFPLKHGGADPAALFSTLAATLRQLPFPQDVVVAASPPAAARPHQEKPLAALQTLGGGLVRWLSPLWHPPLAGELSTAADTAAQVHTFYRDEDEIRVTCEWRAAVTDQPAILRIAWQASLSCQGELWVQLRRRDDPAMRLTELVLGSALEGERVWSAHTLGFDPSRIPWAMRLVVTEPSA
jgi:hypothetical protein